MVANLRTRAERSPAAMRPSVRRPRETISAKPARGTSAVRKAVVDSVIFVVWAILEYVDIILLVSQAWLRALWWPFGACMAAVRSEEKPRHVVIVGASFGGLAAQRSLSGERGVKVTLIDFKSYFEYTPGILRCYVQPGFIKQLTCPLPASRNELIRGAMTGVDEAAVVMRDPNGTVRRVPFDYLLLAVGSTYADPIKPLEAEPTLVERAASWDEAAAKLAAASTVIVVGAGPVGVELAGEILTAYPEKRVTFVDMAPTILPGFDEAAASFTKQWFAARGAEMKLGEPIEAIRSQSVLLKSGELLESDVVYKCVGVMPNTDMLKDSPLFSGTFGFRDSISVNDHLQLDGNPKIYCVGDMMNHASRELKLGHTAEVNAHLAAHNILADLHGEPLLTYPRGVTGADTTPKIWCLSLGKYDAVVGFNGLVLCGWYVAVLKWLLEWTKIAAAAERPIGIVFWKVADTSSCWLHRTLLPPPNPKKAL